MESLPGLGVYAIKVDANTIQLASSQADAFAGTAISLSDTGTNSSTVFDPRGGPAQSVVTSGGDAKFFSADHGLSTAEKIYFDNDITTPSLTLVEGTTKSKATPLLCPQGRPQLLPSDAFCQQPRC